MTKEENTFIEQRESSEILTVLMSVKNGEPFIRETVKSVLSQTYKDFVFLILDNASIDKTRKIIKSYDDPRIKLIELSKDIGQVAALKKGVELCKTKYIARIDADDINMPERFEKQISFLENNPTVGICGTFTIAFTDKNEKYFKWPTNSDDIKVKLHFECCLAHPSVMIRRELLIKYKLNYNDNLKHSYDWDLWQRCSRCFPIVNIPEFLLKYRLHEQSESIKTSHFQKETAEYLDNNTLKILKLENHPLKIINRDVAFETLNLKKRDKKYLNNVVEWFDQLLESNLKFELYSHVSLRKFLKIRLLLVLNYNIKHRATVLKIFFKEKIYLYINFSESVKFILKFALSFAGIYRRYVK